MEAKISRREVERRRRKKNGNFESGPIEYTFVSAPFQQFNSNFPYWLTRQPDSFPRRNQSLLSTLSLVQSASHRPSYSVLRIYLAFLFLFRVFFVYFEIQRDMLCEFLWPRNIFFFFGNFVVVFKNHSNVQTLYLSRWYFSHFIPAFNSAPPTICRYCFLLRVRMQLQRHTAIIHRSQSCTFHSHLQWFDRIHSHS